MNNNELSEDEFASILKVYGLESPCEQFSEDLSHLIVLKYRENRVPVYAAGRWLGKCILAILVLFNLLFLFYLNGISVQPVITFSVAAFVIGFWVLIPLMRKIKSQTDYM